MNRTIFLIPFVLGMLVASTSAQQAVPPDIPKLYTDLPMHPKLYMAERLADTSLLGFTDLQAKLWNHHVRLTDEGLVQAEIVGPKGSEAGGLSRGRVSGGTPCDDQAAVREVCRVQRVLGNGLGGDSSRVEKRGIYWGLIRVRP